MSDEYDNTEILANVDVASDEHPTTMMASADELNSLQTHYSCEYGSADYYAWSDGQARTEYGHFVSLAEKRLEIKICEGADIFGVTISRAAFIGNQSQDGRDYKYGLVATNGVVEVRCESDVRVGDNVISNEYGVATKTDSDCGYKVIAIETRLRVDYAIIALGVQACTTDVLDQKLQRLDGRVGANEINIAAAINVANEAHNKASETLQSNQNISNKVDGALGTVDDMVTRVEDLGDQVLNTAITAAQARAIAESASTTAESMHKEAVDVANEALTDTSKLRKEFEAKIAEIDVELDKAAFELEATKENIETTRDELQINIDGVSSELDDTKNDLNNIRDELSSDIDDILNSISDTDKTIASITKKVDENEAFIDTLAVWKEETNVTITDINQKTDANSGSISILTAWKSDVEDDVESIVSIKTQSDANKSSIEELTNWKGTTSETLTSVKQQSDANTASIDAITLWQGETTESIAEVRQQADDNAANIKTLTEWMGPDSESIASIEQRVDGIESSVSSLTSWQGDAKTSIANVEQKSNANESKINSLTSWQSEATESIANVEQKANENESDITGLTTWKGEATESITAVTQTANKNSADISVIATWKSDVEDDVSSIASIKTTANENKASIEQLVKKDTELSTTIAGVKTTADNNKASIEQITSWQSQVDPTINSVAGIKQTADGNAAKIEGLVSWQGTTNTAMARIEQKADANGAYIESTVSNMDKYSVGPYSQAYGFTLEQAREVLEEDMVYVPTGTATHTEKYKYTETDAGGNEVVKEYTYSFTPGYIYTWSDVDTSAQTETFMWKESVGRVVSFGTAPSGNAYDFWYTNSDTVSDGYESYTLYKLEEYKNEAGQTLTQWVAVATLQGNSNSRAVSQIRQDANNIELRVTDTEGNYAGLREDLTDTNATVQTVASWKSSVESDVSNIATIKSTADAASTSISQVVEAVGKDGEVNAASIVTAVNKAGSSVVIDADHVNLNGYVTMTNLSTEGETVIDGANIKTGKIDAERIKVEDLQALGANIAGWQITEDQLFYEDKSTNIEVGLSPGQGGTYNTDQNLGLVLYAGQKADSEPKAIAGTWRFSDNIILQGLNINNLKFNFSGWFYNNSTGWCKYKNQPANLSFVYDDSTGEQTIVLQIKNLDSENYGSRTLYGRYYNSYTGKYDVVDSIGTYLLNREIGFGLGIDDFAVLYEGNSTSSFLNDVLKPNATFIPGSIGLYPSMLDRNGRLYAEEIRLGGSTNSMIDVDKGAIGNIVINDGAMVYKKGWAQDGGFYLGRDGLSVGSNFTVQSQGVATKSIIVGGAADVHTDGTVACETLNATDIVSTSVTATNIEGDNCTLQSITLNDINGDGAALFHSDASYVHCNAKFMLSIQENGSTSGRWQGMMIDFGPDTLKTSSSTALRIGPVAGGFQVLSSGTVKDASGNVVHTSDARLKHDIESLDERYDDFFDNLKAQRFKYNVGTSDRYHIGYTTQGVQAALVEAEIPEQEFAGVVTFNQGTEDEESALRYYEFVSLNTDQIQKLKKRVDTLEAKNAELEERLAKLEALLINNTK